MEVVSLKNIPLTVTYVTWEWLYCKEYFGISFGFSKSLIPYKHRSNSKSKNLIQYKNKNINLNWQLIFKLDDFSTGFLNSFFNWSINSLLMFKGIRASMNKVLWHSFLQGWNPPFSEEPPLSEANLKCYPPLSKSHPNGACKL